MYSCNTAINLFLPPWTTRKSSHLNVVFVMRCTSHTKPHRYPVFIHCVIPVDNDYECLNARIVVIPFTLPPPRSLLSPLHYIVPWCLDYFYTVHVCTLFVNYVIVYSTTTNHKKYILIKNTL